MTGLNEHVQIPDAEVFRDFFEQISRRAALELSLDVQTHSMPNTIQWGSFAQPHLYTFDAGRAREEGLDSLVEEAIRRIRADKP